MKLRVLDPGRCTGQCCRNFLLTLDLTANAQKVVRMLKQLEPIEPRTVDEETGEITMWNPHDGAYIADMVIPFYGPYQKDAPAQARFTCKHFDGVGCTEYENRPKLCSDHGLYSGCDHVDNGCTFDQKANFEKRFREVWPRRHEEHLHAWIRQAAVYLRTGSWPSDKVKVDDKHKTELSVEGCAGDGVAELEG